MASDPLVRRLAEYIAFPNTDLHLFIACPDSKVRGPWKFDRTANVQEVLNTVLKRKKFASCDPVSLGLYLDGSNGESLRMENKTPLWLYSLQDNVCSWVLSDSKGV